MEEILFTVPEIAKLLKTNPNYVHNLRKSGQLRFMKIGQFKCRKSTLDKFLEEVEGKDITDPFNVKELENEITVQEE